MLSCFHHDFFAILQFVFVFSCVEYDGYTYNGYKYPVWAESIAMMLAALAIVQIPLWAIIKFANHIGSCYVSYTSIYFPASHF